MCHWISVHFVRLLLDIPYQRSERHIVFSKHIRVNEILEFVPMNITIENENLNCCIRRWKGNNEYEWIHDSLKKKLPLLRIQFSEYNIPTPRFSLECSFLLYDTLPLGAYTPYQLFERNLSNTMALTMYSKKNYIMSSHIFTAFVFTYIHLVSYKAFILIIQITERGFYNS